MSSTLCAYFTLYLNIFTEDLLRYVIGAGGVYLVINLALRRLLERRQIREDRPKAAQICREIAASLRTVAIFAAVGSVIALGYRAGFIRLYFDVDQYGLLWLVASLLILILAQDAWFFWSHRLLHNRRLFRLFHRLHHRSHNPTSFTSYSFDIGEAVVQAIYLPLALLVVPSHPIVLFLFTAHMMLRNAIGHCGVEVFPAGRDGKPLFGWLTTVTHHDLHHRDGRWNRGLYFTWWDRICGTEHPRYLEEFARVARSAAVAILILGLAGAGQAEAQSAEPACGSEQPRCERPAPHPANDLRISIPGVFS